MSVCDKMMLMMLMMLMEVVISTLLTARDSFGIGEVLL